MPRLRILLTNVGLRQIRHLTETLNSRWESLLSNGGNVRKAMNSSFCDLTFIQKKDGKKEKGIIDMYDYKIVEQVSRKKKSMSGVLRKVMILFAVIFVIMGIAISQSFMLAGISSCCAIFCV